jgi:hypothetical protein
VSSEQVLSLAAGAVALVALAVAVRAQRRAARAEAVVADLAQRLDAPAPTPARDEPGPGAYVITTVDTAAEPGTGAPVRASVAEPIDGRLFADIVARETVVRAASWTHGLRRALSPEARNRIRFEVRQETRRAGRARRAEMKQALREFRARERAAARDDRSVGEDVA